ncbi:hypothetical protein AB4Z22_00200 [Paenibacillus sp. TAF58]
MSESNPVAQSIHPVTILVRYKNEEGDQEVRYPGYHTGGNNAMYVTEYGALIFVEIEPTEDSSIYVDLSGWTQLGNIKDASGDTETMIGVLTNKLHRMTAYDFLAKVLVHVREDFDFEGAIIPNLLNDESNIGGA